MGCGRFDLAVYVLSDNSELCGKTGKPGGSPPEVGNEKSSIQVWLFAIVRVGDVAVAGKLRRGDNLNANPIGEDGNDYYQHQ